MLVLPRCCVVVLLQCCVVAVLRYGGISIFANVKAVRLWIF